MMGQLTPDDKWIVFISIESGKRLLHKMSIDGREDTILSEIGVYPNAPALSPDGKWIAFGFVDPVRHDYRLAIIPFGGGNPTTTFDVPSVTRIEWTRDGKALTYVALQDGADNLWEQPVVGGPPRRVTNFKQGRIFRFAWSWDGRLLAMARGEETSDIIALQRTD